MPDLTPPSYRLIRGIARLLARLFYARIEVIGLERVPALGALIVAANHQNALVDPMLLLAAIPRRLRPVAKAPLFRHPLIAPLLWLAGAIPVHRRHDAGRDPPENVTMFRAVAGILGTGGAILVFPEGVSQPEPVLMPLRTGVARMLLAAEPGPARSDVTLLPVGLLYRMPGAFRSGRALILIGAPIDFADCVALARQAPEDAVRWLTTRLTEALRGLVVEAEDRETFRLLELAEAVWRQERGGGRPEPAVRAAWLRRGARAARHLRTHAPARVESLRRALTAYAADLERSGLTLGRLEARYPLRTVTGYALREGAALLAGLPLALWGMASHVVPWQLTALAARVLRPSGDTEATVKVVAGVVLYPISWAGEAGLAWWLGGGWALGAFLAALVPTGLLALSWRERLDRVRRDARGYLAFLGHRDLVGRLQARRRALLHELEALASIVPEAVLADRPRADR